ncbi:MAG TPA: hypothetical protein VJH21_01500 [Candidatus Paceibacterota bacterium]
MNSEIQDPGSLLEKCPITEDSKKVLAQKIADVEKWALVVGILKPSQSLMVKIVRRKEILAKPTSEEWETILNAKIPKQARHMLELIKNGADGISFNVGEGHKPTSWNMALRKSGLPFRLRPDEYGVSFPDKTFRLRKVV